MDDSAADTTATTLHSATKVSVYKRWVWVEIVVLSVLTVMVWCLLSLPIVFYHLPSSTEETLGILNQACAGGVPQAYERSLCREELESVQRCFLGESSELLIPEHIKQNATVDHIQLLLDGLELLQPSMVCKAAVRPFLCLYELGLCDSNRNSYQPTMQQCIEISTVLCPNEWKAASTFLGPSASLPECDMFPDDPRGCSANVASSSGSGSAPHSSNEPTSNNGNSTENCSIECQDGFYCEPGDNVCSPQCDTWKEHPHITSLFIDVVTVLSTIVGIVSAVAVFVLSFMRRKRMFTFPSIFVVYMTGSLTLLGLFVLLSYTNRGTLYCSSRNLIESSDNPTVFCSLSGAVFYYTLMQVTLWWILHVGTLFWKIVCPFHARRFEVNKKTKHIHITAVLSAVVLPFVPVGITFFKGGFGLTRFPPILCTGTQSDVTFYSLILPITLLLATGITMLIIMFLLIHKRHGLFRARQSKQPFKMGIAEKKILVIFCYYVVLSVIAITAFTLTTRNVELFVARLAQYFLCERVRTDPNELCSRERFEKLRFPWVTATAFVLLGMFPAVNLIFAANIQEVKQVISTCCNVNSLIRVTKESSMISSAANTSLSQKNTLQLQDIQ